MELINLKRIDKARDERWRRGVKENANGACVHCGKPGGAHHIVPRGCLETRYVLENGIYVCDWLHRVFERAEDDEIRSENIRIYITWDRYNNLWKIANYISTIEDFGFQEVV